MGVVKRQDRPRVMWWAILLFRLVLITPQDISKIYQNTCNFCY